MYNICTFLERVIKILNIKIKIVYWKIKYGKRIKVGKNLRFRKRFSLNISKEGYVEIGDNVFFNDDCSINCHEKIVIGNNCKFGQGVLFFDHDHDLKKENISNELKYITEPVVIGNNCWVGASNMLLRGTTIKDNCIIGAGCILKKTIERNSIYIQKREDEIRSYKE